MASANPVRRTAAVAGLAFALLTVAVGVGAYAQRDDTVTVAVRDPQSDPGTDGQAADGSVVPADEPADDTAPTPDETATPESPASDTTAPDTTAPDSTAPGDTATSTSAPSTTSTGPTSTTSAGTSTTSTSTTSTTVAPAPLCPELDGSSPRRTSFAAAPPVCIDERATYKAVMETSEGTIKIALDSAKAPKTVNNFVFLSRFHFYDGLTIHRVVPGFIIQGGDPLANSNGGPGYTFEDELPGKDGYDIGAVAMANSGVNTNGSQFFIVTGPTGKALTGTYSTFGKVTSGTSVLKAIDALGRPPGENAVEYPPERTITIKSVTITAVGERRSRIPGFTAVDATTTTVG